MDQIESKSKSPGSLFCPVFLGFFFLSAVQLCREVRVDVWQVKRKGYNGYRCAVFYHSSGLPLRENTLALFRLSIIPHDGPLNSSLTYSTFHREHQKENITRLVQEEVRLKWGRAGGIGLWPVQSSVLVSVFCQAAASWLERAPDVPKAWELREHLFYCCASAWRHPCFWKWCNSGWQGCFEVCFLVRVQAERERDKAHCLKTTWSFDLCAALLLSGFRTIHSSGREWEGALCRGYWFLLNKHQWRAGCSLITAREAVWITVWNNSPDFLKKKLRKVLPRSYYGRSFIKASPLLLWEPTVTCIGK